MQGGRWWLGFHVFHNFPFGALPDMSQTLSLASEETRCVKLTMPADLIIADKSSLRGLRLLIPCDGLRFDG